jgi:hypothetical protein
LDWGAAHRKAATYTGQQKQKKHGQTDMHRVGFEATIPVFEQVKTFHAVDRTAIVISAIYSIFMP